MTGSASGLKERPGRTPAKTPDAPTLDGDERLRGLIRAELERQNALPVARRTLELLAEAASEPAQGSPGYRIVDRIGETRLRPVSPEQAKKGETPDIPFDLGDLVAELRERHADLFGRPPPPEPEPTPETEPNTTIHDTVAHVRAAGARFVETQSSFARTLAARSAGRGRALAASAGVAVEAWRTRLKTHRSAVPEPGKPMPETQPASPAATTLSGRASATQSRSGWLTFGRDALARLKPHGAERVAVSDDPIEAPQGRSDGGGRRQTVAIGLGGLTALAFVAALVVTARRDTGTTPPDITIARRDDAVTPNQPTPPAAPPVTAQPPAAQDPTPTASPQATSPGPTSPGPASPGPTSVDPEEQPDDAQPSNPTDVVGVPEVIDTATLRVAGKVIHLFGVEWVRGGQADELAKYLARRTVTCQPAAGSSAYLCSVNGKDLSEVVLFNGGGRASPEASPDLVAAEDHARTERLGVWKR